MRFVKRFLKFEGVWQEVRDREVPGGAVYIDGGLGCKIGQPLTAGTAGRALVEWGSGRCIYAGNSYM